MSTVYHGDVVAAVIDPPINPGLGLSEKGSIRLPGICHSGWLAEEKVDQQFLIRTLPSPILVSESYWWDLKWDPVFTALKLIRLTINLLLGGGLGLIHDKWSIPQGCDRNQLYKLT